MAKKYKALANIQDKKFKKRKGDIITEAEYGKLSESQKKRFKEVKLEVQEVK